MFYSIWNDFFFGYNLDNQEKEVIHFSNGIKEQIEEIKSGEAKLTPIEDLFKHFGFEDTRSEAEKFFDSEKFNIERAYSQKITETLYNLEREYLKIPES